MGKAGGGLICFGIYLVMSWEAPMQLASKSGAAYANRGNSSGWGSNPKGPSIHSTMPHLAG